MSQKRSDGTTDVRPIPDEELVRLILAGETERFGEVVHRHYGKVYAICFAVTRNREDSNDLAQEVFTNCFLHLDRIQDPRKLAQYIARAARNRALTLVKQRRAAQRRHMNMFHRIADTFRAEEYEPADTDDLELRDAVRRKIDCLPRKSREVICLYYFDQLSTPDIAVLLGVNEAVIRKRLEYGRNALRAALEREIEPAIQTPEERRKRIAFIIGALPLTTPKWTKPGATTSVAGTPGRRTGLIAATAGLGAVAIIGALAYFSDNNARTRTFDSNSAPVPAPSRAPNITEQSPAPIEAAKPTQQPVIPLERASTDVLPGHAPSSVRVGPPPYTANPAILEFLESVASDFAAHSGINVTVNISPSQLGDSTSAPNSGDLGDLMLFENGESGHLDVFARLIAENSVVRLNDLISDPDFEQQDFFPNLWSSVTVDGDIWGIPLIVRSWALGVDADTVDSFALERDHTNWSQLLQTVAGERFAGYVSDPLADNLVQLPGQIVWDSLFLSAGGRFGTATHANNPITELTFAQFRSLVKQNPGAFRPLSEARTLVGRCAATVVTDGTGGANCLSTLKLDNPSWVAVCPSGSPPVPLHRYSVLAIKRSTNDREQVAWAFAKYLLSPSLMRKICTLHGLTPIRESVARQMADRDTQVFVRQVRNMIFPGPDTSEHLRRAARNDAIAGILGERTDINAAIDEVWGHE